MGGIVVDCAHFCAHPLHGSITSRCQCAVNRAERGTRKSLSARNLSQGHAMNDTACVPIAKLLILIAFIVRDQEAGGSNPLAPTNLNQQLTANDFLV